MRTILAWFRRWIGALVRMFRRRGKKPGRKDTTAQRLRSVPDVARPPPVSERENDAEPSVFSESTGVPEPSAAERTVPVDGGKDEGESLVPSVSTDAPEPSAAEREAVADGGEEREFPAPRRVVEVSNGNELAMALWSARPGDHIVLGDGTYTHESDFTTFASGTAFAPIVVRAKNKLRARLKRSLVVAHPHYRLWGIDIDGVRLSVDRGADGLVVRRCRARGFHSYQGIWCRVKAKDCRFEYCDISMPNCRGISMDLGSGARNLVIERCYFHDWGPKAERDQTFEPIQIGFGKADTDVTAGAVVRLCLFENINQDNRENETISLKSSGNRVEQCHLRNARQITVRHGENNRVEGCRLENTGARKPSRIQVFDEKNVVSNCVSPEIQLSAGDVEPNAMTASGQHPAAWDCKVISCTGTVVVGAQESPKYTVEARNNTVEDNRGAVVLRHETGTKQKRVPSEKGLPTITLKKSDVGPDAP